MTPDLLIPENLIDTSDNGLTDDEIAVLYPHQLASRRPFIYLVETTEDPLKRVIHAAQARPMLVPRNLDNPDSSKELIIGIVRCSQRNTLEVIERNNLKEGVTLKLGQTIFVRDSTAAKNDQQLYWPRQDSNGMILLSEDGMPIFRSVFVEIEGEGETDSVLDYRTSNIHIAQYRNKLRELLSKKTQE